MIIRSSIKYAAWSLCLSGVLLSCAGSPDTPNPTVETVIQQANNGADVVVHAPTNPDALNPITSNSANAAAIQNNIFQRLLVLDYENPADLIPQLAKSMPIITPLEDGPYAGGMSLKYEIHPDATWDNGTPITAEDYIFTIKILKHNGISNTQYRPYVHFIDAVEIDATNDKIFTIFSKERYFKAEEGSGSEPYIIPEYIYDPEGVMRQYTIAEIKENGTKLQTDQNYSNFAAIFNSAKFASTPEGIIGSGPYTLKEWKDNQRIVLERKKDWWGNKHQNIKTLEVRPTKIIYKIISDATAAVTIAKDGQLDVLKSIPANKFIELKEDSKFTSNFDLNTPDQFSYYYIGFNSKRPQFQDKRVRRAIAHLIDRDDIIETVFERMAIKTNGPINPQKPYYNKDLKDIEFDVEQAQKLLAEAGWKDSDGDNILDKIVNGKKESFTVKFKYNTGNIIRKTIGQLLKDQASRAGINVELTPVEWGKLITDANKRDFDMLCLAWVNAPSLDDLKQVWHSSNDVEGGGNRVGFGTEESDKIIDDIRVTLDPAKRNALYNRIQEIIYEEQPYVFLFVPSERIAIHNRFTDTKSSALDPGYRIASFKLRSSAAKEQ